MRLAWLSENDSTKHDGGKRRRIRALTAKTDHVPKDKNATYPSFTLISDANVAAKLTFLLHFPNWYRTVIFFCGYVLYHADGLNDCPNDCPSHA